MHSKALVASFVVLFGGMGYQASRMGAFLFGPVLTSFGPMRSYADARRSRNLPTTVASVFWAATGVWGRGIVGLIGALASLGH